jgi:hypothetical protein
MEHPFAVLFGNKGDLQLVQGVHEEPARGRVIDSIARGRGENRSPPDAMLPGASALACRKLLRFTVYPGSPWMALESS